MLYFAFEAVDGVGKTTTMRNVAKILQDERIDFVCTKEPGGPRALAAEWSYDLVEYYGPAYEGFRDLCVNNPEIPSKAKRALYLADSLMNWELVVKPALVEGQIVLSDRSWVSDLAYGSVLADLSLEALFAFNNSLVPARKNFTNVIYLHLPSYERERRLVSNVTNSMDSLGSETRDKICTQYNKISNHYFDESTWFAASTIPDEEAVARQIASYILDTSDS